MKKQLKSAVSVLMCLLLIFGQCTPYTAEGNTASGDHNIMSVSESVYQDAASSEEKVNFAPESLEDPVISGKLKLPPECAAPLTGLNVSIYATNGSSNHFTIVSISGGESEVDYSLNVKPGTGYVVYYQTSHPDYVGTMYSGYMGMVRNKSSAAVFDLSAGDKTVDLTLTPMRIITGKLTLPGNTTSTKYRATARTAPA